MSVYDRMIKGSILLYLSMRLAMNLSIITLLTGFILP